MSQQGAGIGTRGPGETQLEVDRRRILGKIAKLERDLAGVARPATRSARPAAGRSIRWWPSSATPTPASRRCSTA